MTDKELLGVIYDVLAMNSVDPLAADEILRRIDHVDFDDMTIVFDAGENKQLVLKANRT